MLTDRELAQIAAEEGIRPEYLHAILDTEASPSDNTIAKTTSAAGERAYGRGQLLPSTFEKLVPNGDIKNPVDNARAAARYIKEGLSKNEGDFGSAAGYYFAGPGWLKKMSANPDQNYGGTTITDYIDRARGHLENRMSMNSMSPEDAPDFSGVSGEASMDVGAAAKSSTPTFPVRNTITDLANRATAQVDKIDASGAALSDSIKSNLAAQTESVGRAGELNATIALEKYKQESIKGNENAVILSNIGLNTSDADSLVAQTATAMKQEYLQAQAMRDAIEAKRSVGLFDSPIEYIINQFTLPKDIQEHNAVVRKIESQKVFVDQSAAFVKETASANLTKFASVTAASAEASANLAREQATEASLKINERLNETDYNYQVKTLNAIDTRLKIALMQQAEEDRQGVRADKAEMAKRKADAEEADNLAVKTAGNILGYRIPDRKTLDKSPKAMKDAVEYVMANGGGVGNDPYTAWQVLSRGDPRSMPVAVKYQRDTLESVRRQAEEAINTNPLAKTASPKQRQEMLSQKMSELLNSAMSDPNSSIRSNSAGVIDNPYHTPPLEVMTKIPASRGLPITKIITDAKKALPTQDMTDGTILELGYANIGVKYKDITEAAADVSKYYQAAVEHNNEAMKFDRFGMAEQHSYKIKGGIDMTNPASIVKYYISKQKKAIMEDTFRGTFAASGDAGQSQRQGEIAAEERRQNLNPAEGAAELLNR